MTKIEPVRNMSGVSPKGDRVVVMPDIIEEVTAGGIIIPETERTKHQLAQATGVLVATGADAWVHTVTVTERLIDGVWKEVERTRTGFSEPFAKVGDRVCFAKYNGIQFDGNDGHKYRLLNDQDITAVASDEVDFSDMRSRAPLSQSAQ